MIAGQPVFSVSLAGTSPVTGAEETVTVMTRELPRSSTPSMWPRLLFRLPMTSPR